MPNTARVEQVHLCLADSAVPRRQAANAYASFDFPHCQLVRSQTRNPG